MVTLLAVQVSIILTEVDNGMPPGWMGEGNSLSVLGDAGSDAVAREGRGGE